MYFFERPVFYLAKYPGKIDMFLQKSPLNMIKIVLFVR